jgi:hypothetical protein
MKARLARMLEEAQDRRHDADILGSSLATRSDSQAFLRVLAFEVLLKAAVLASGAARAGGHKYTELWDKLPATTQDMILAVARTRMPGNADLSDLGRLFFWYQFVFERARYGYELYDGYTPEEVRELGKYWAELGAPIEEALVQYYPSELECLTEGLIQYVQNAL